MYSGDKICVSKIVVVINVATPEKRKLCTVEAAAVLSLYSWTPGFSTRHFVAIDPSRAKTKGTDATPSFRSR
jgi:hypothetical protein